MHDLLSWSQKFRKKRKNTKNPSSKSTMMKRKKDKMKQKKPLDRQIFNGGQPFEKGDGKLFRQFQECTQFNGTRYYGESACFCSRPVSAKTAC